MLEFEWVASFGHIPVSDMEGQCSRAMDTESHYSVDLPCYPQLPGLKVVELARMQDNQETLKCPQTGVSKSLQMKR
jgi:hypothetical protein